MFKQLVLLVVVLLTLSVSFVYAQAPEMQWHKGHGTNNGDHVHYGLQTSDGGYIMTGQTSEGRRGSSDCVLAMSLLSSGMVADAKSPLSVFPEQ